MPVATRSLELKMNTDIAIADLGSLGKLRTHMHKKVTYVYASDACKICGLKNTSQTVRRLADQHKRRMRVDTSGGSQSVWMLTIQGFLALVLSSGTRPDRDPIIDRLYVEMVQSTAAAGGGSSASPKPTRPVPDAAYQLAEPVLQDVVLSANQFATFEDHHKEIGYQRYLRLCEYYAAGGREPFPVASGQAMTEGRRISEKEFQRWFRPDRTRLERLRQDNIRRYESHQFRIGHGS